MAKHVTINLFDVEQGETTQPLRDTLDEFASLPIDRRWRSDIRLEKVELAPADAVLRREAYHLDFAKLRDIGPGKMSHARPVGDIGMARDEMFGEESAALYLPRKNWLLVLHNQYGIGPSRMAEYFNALDPGSAERHFDYCVRPKIDTQALHKMRAMQNFSDVEVVANVGAFEGAQDAVGEAVSETVNAARAVRIHLRLMANRAYGHGGHLGIDAARQFIAKLLMNVEEVDKIKVKDANESLDMSDRVVDLIEHKIRLRYPDTMLIVSNHRYTYASKIDLLRRACSEWLRRLG